MLKALLTLEYSKETIMSNQSGTISIQPMLHLAIDSKEFTYLNYLAVMSAIRFNDVTMWTREIPKNNKYWKMIKKMKRIEFKEIHPVTGITVDQHDFTGSLDIIYMANMKPRMVNDAMIDHKGMYDDDGEFVIKDMILVKVRQPELITLDYVRDSKSGIAQLIRKILLERVWYVF